MKETTVRCDGCKKEIREGLETVVEISTTSKKYDFCSGCGYVISATLKKLTGDTSSAKYDKSYLEILAQRLKAL